MEKGRIYIDRVKVLLEPDPEDEREVEGILNPAVAGNFLLYRAVGRNNFSRVMAAELISDPTGQTSNIVARKMNKVVLEPQEDYERVDDKHGGIEDPRVTELSDGTYVMFYTGYGRPSGFTKQVPLVALATSTNGLDWQRQGRIIFTPYEQPGGKTIDFNLIPNKDTVLFSEKINGRYALLHRPMFTRRQAEKYQIPWRGIWYAEADNLIGPWDSHRLVLGPKFQWEHGGVGAGVPPIHLNNSWLHIYHGFTPPSQELNLRRYSAGVFMTAHDKPYELILQSNLAVLEPTIPAELAGIVPQVVFPTAVWEQDTNPTNLALFWGAADTCIVWGVLHLPEKMLKPFADNRHGSAI